MNRFRQKVAIVTGAASGIGRAIASRLGGEGASVTVNYLHGGDAAASEVVREVERRGGRGFAYQADVGSAAQVRAMFEATLATFGRVDVVVNNAALAMTKPIVEVTEQEFDRIFAVNVRAHSWRARRPAGTSRPGGA